MVWQVVIRNPRDFEEEWFRGEFPTKEDVWKATKVVIAEKGEEEIPLGHWNRLTADCSKGENYLKRYEGWISLTKVLMGDRRREERGKDKTIAHAKRGVSRSDTNPSNNNTSSSGFSTPSERDESINVGPVRNIMDYDLDGSPDQAPIIYTPGSAPSETNVREGILLTLEKDETPKRTGRGYGNGCPLCACHCVDERKGIDPNMDRIEWVMEKIMDSREGENAEEWISVLKDDKTFFKAVTKELRKRREMIALKVMKLKIDQGAERLEYALKLLAFMERYGKPEFEEESYGSEGEMAIVDYLRDHNIEFEREYRVKIMDNYRRFDFIVPSKKLLMEFDGIQHFEEVLHFSKKGKEPLEVRRKIDLAKNKWATDNGFHLLRIPHWSMDDIPEIIEEALSKISEGCSLLVPPDDYFGSGGGVSESEGKGDENVEQPDDVFSQCGTYVINAWRSRIKEMVNQVSTLDEEIQHLSCSGLSSSDSNLAWLQQNRSEYLEQLIACQEQLSRIEERYQQKSSNLEKGISQIGLQ